MSETDSVEDSLVLASNSAAMELQRTQRAQNEVRRWVSTAMISKINDLEKELESQERLDRKNKKDKEVLERQRSQAQLTRLQNMEKRHKRQDDVYEEAQRIVEERRQQAIEKVQKWDTQVHGVLCDKEHNHQIRKDIQRMASSAMESLNDKIREQRVKSKIDTEELQKHMDRCLSHKLFDPIPAENIKEKMVTSPRSLRPSRSAQTLQSPRCSKVSPAQRDRCAQSPKYRYRPIERMVSLTIQSDRY